MVSGENAERRHEGTAAQTVNGLRPLDVSAAEGKSATTSSGDADSTHSDMGGQEGVQGWKVSTSQLREEYSFQVNCQKRSML